jgi:hypothetical protein
MRRVVSVLPLAVLLVTIPLAGCGNSGGVVSPPSQSSNETLNSSNQAVTNNSPITNMTNNTLSDNNVSVVPGNDVANATSSNNETTNNPSATAPADTSYTSYTNARFQFQLSVPSSFHADPPPTDGDGQTWENSTNTSKISVVGAYNVTGATLSSLYSTATAARTSYSPGQSSEGANWYLVSGTLVNSSGRTECFTEKVYVGSEYTYQLTLTYPVSQTTAYQQLVQTVVSSFTPGPLS